MRAVDVKVGEAYLAEHEYNRAEKVTVLEVPVVRMVRASWRLDDKRMKPLRRDGRADGARVRIEATGETVDIALVKIRSAWDESDDRREVAREDCIRRVAAVREKLGQLGLPCESDLWRGSAAHVDVCTGVGRGTG